MHRFLGYHYVETKINLVLLGDSGVGKTSAVKGFVVGFMQNKNFEEDLPPSLTSCKVDII
jgi:GTPase SAR1 family protein